MASRVARCSCHQLTAICEGVPVRLSVCHCAACKARTGSAFSFNATFPTARVRAAGEFLTYVRTAEAGRECRYRFCPRCGATVFYALDARPGTISVPAGAFVDQDLPAPTIEVYADRRVDWCTLDPQIVAEDG